MMTRGFGRFSAVLLVCFVPFSAVGQTTFGSITGTVTDQTGAVITRADVTVINENTAFERKVQTTESGVFNVPNLAVGSYRVRIEAQGFRGYQQSGLALNANQVVSVDVQL